MSDQARLPAIAAALAEHAAALAALSDEVRAMGEPVEPPAPDPAPEPPAPEPPPVEPPTPPADLPIIQTQPLNRARLVSFDGWYKGGTYEREQRLEVWRGVAATTTIHRRMFAWDVKPAPLAYLPARTYDVMVDGPVARFRGLCRGAGRQDRDHRPDGRGRGLADAGTRRRGRRGVLKGEEARALAEQYGVHESAVSQWLKAARQKLEASA